jgi:hypothetical protein
MIQLTSIIVAAMGVLTSTSPLNHNRKEPSVMAYKTSTEKSASRKSYPFREMHGLGGTQDGGPVYQSWTAMRRRCEDVNFEKYPKYGGAGIKICLALHFFEKFINLLGERPDGKTLDRIDNDGNYSCGECSDCIANGWKMNCRWSTPKEQSRNSSTMRWMTINGEKICLTDAAKKYGISLQTLSSRVNKQGMPDEEAVLTPVRKFTRHKK